MSMTFENLLVDVSERIATVTFNRPKVLNALNARTIEELDECVRGLGEDSAVGAVIFTGAGEKAFVAGADITELARYSPQQAQECAQRGQGVFGRIERLGKPTIAAINGYALGGGCELALACSMRIASTTARLGQPEVKIGIIPGYGGSQRLPRLIGKGMALEMILSGEPLAAEEALRWGLVNRVVAPEELMPAARALAGKILANGPLAVRYSLEAVNQGAEQPLDQGLFLESAMFGVVFATEDMREGTEAFLEKRAPKFKGK
jgi:enoyl-CoA hydratase